MYDKLKQGETPHTLPFKVNADDKYFFCPLILIMYTIITFFWFIFIKSIWNGVHEFIAELKHFWKYTIKDYYTQPKD